MVHYSCLRTFIYYLYICSLYEYVKKKEANAALLCATVLEQSPGISGGRQK